MIDVKYFKMCFVPKNMFCSLFVCLVFFVAGLLVLLFLKQVSNSFSL